MNKVFSKVKGLFTEIKTFWKKPKPGQFVSYKELTAFCIGASGNNSVAVLSGYVTFAASCLLVGTIYGIDFMDIYKIGLIGMPLSFLFNPINMIIQDNLGDLEGKTKVAVHSLCVPLGIVGIAFFFLPQNFIPGLETFLPSLPKIIGIILTTSVFNVYYKILTYKLLSPRFGKFICWVVSGCLPCLAMFMLIVFLPFSDMPYFNRLWILHLCFSMFNIFLVFTQQLGNIQNVMSPNTDERAKIVSIGSFVFSLVPSLVSILLPVFAQLAGGFTSIKTYRILFPILFVIFTVVALFLAFGGVKEKVVMCKTHRAKVPFIKGFKAVIKNKYYWIQNLSNVPGALTAGSIVLANIIFIYVSRQEWLLGVYAGITGTAFIPGMLLAPWLIKKLGKRKLTIIARVFSIVAGVAIAFSASTGSVPLFIIFNYIALLVNAPTVVINSAMTADIWDYQQYKTGERLDGCAGIFPLLLSPITAFAGFLVPLIYKMFNFSTDWDILYVPELRNPIIWSTVAVSTICGIISLVPWFFYDLTEAKHKEIIVELQRRADEADGVINDDDPNSTPDGGGGGDNSDGSVMIEALSDTTTDVLIDTPSTSDITTGPQDSSAIDHSSDNMDDNKSK